MGNTSQRIVKHDVDDCQFISVIVPVYNEKENLAVCLQSIKAQNYHQDKIEIIVVDDGSTDESADIASEFGAKVIYQEHAGAAAARNKGIEEASGALIAFLDADDKARECWLETTATYFHEDKVSGVGCNHNLTNRENDFAKISWLEKYFRLSSSSEKVDHLGTSGCLYRKSVIESVGGFNGNFLEAEDMDLSFRVKKQGGILYLIKKPLIHVYYPSSWKVYFRDQIRKSAYLILFRWKSRSDWGKVGSSYSGLTDYIQSLFLYAFLFCLLFAKLDYLLAISTGALLLLLLGLNARFIAFVFRNRTKIELSPFSPIVILFYLIIRALSWSLGLMYSVILILRKSQSLPVTERLGRPLK